MAAVTTGKEYIEAKKVAITFDDGPNPLYTEKLLDGLKERNVKATFFLIGKEVKEYPDIVKRMYEEGHLIGNHTYEHVNLCEVDAKQVKWQVEQTNDLIYEVTGERPVYIRPPYGCWNKQMGEATGMLEILWSVDPRDWECNDTDVLISRVLKRWMMRESFCFTMHRSLPWMQHLRSLTYCRSAGTNLCWRAKSCTNSGNKNTNM